MARKMMNRLGRLLPNGFPRWVRIYDNGGPDAKAGSIDRYTVVYTGRYRRKTGGEFIYVGMSGAPFWPQGVCQHGSSRVQVDRPRHGHVGRRIGFLDLPEDCRTVALRDYLDLWDLVPGNGVGAQEVAREMVSARAKAN